MNRNVSRRMTGTFGAAAVVVLALGGVGYLRTASNADRIDDRNLRELARTGRTIEGTVNNLQAVLENLAGETELDSLKSKAELIPYLAVDSTSARPNAACPDQQRRTAIGIISEQSLRLCYNGLADSIGAAIHARYGRAALRPYLASDYMEAVLLADSSGRVFLWAPDETGIRVHALAALDTVNLRSADDVARLGTSKIVRAPIAGRDYYFYLLPLRIDLVRSDSLADRPAHTTWILGGVTSVSNHRQESLSLHPPVALFLGFLAILGFLAVPIVRVYTMGPRERLRVGNLLYLVFALVLSAGLIGLGLGDFAHYWRLRSDTYAELDSTANAVAENIDAELEYALGLIDGYSDDLVGRLGRAMRTAGEAESDSARFAVLYDTTRTVLDTIRMRARIDADTMDREPLWAPTVYPELHMVFWADSAGAQVAKWTTRDHNTPRVNVQDREYHKAIRDRRAWPRRFHARSPSACAADADTADATTPRRSAYYVESIRSWTTGEKLAAISTRFPHEGRVGDDERGWGVAVVITELASLRHAVVPAGVQVAVVDAGARTLFHTRPERVLEEDFAEETDKADLVRSILHARACRELDVEYGGRRTRLVVRPLTGRPLFVMTLMDRSLLDTVWFEAWFVAAAIFGALAVLVFVLVAVVDRVAHTRLGWIWPDVERPGKYGALVTIAVPLLVVLTLHGLLPGTFPTTPASFLLPVSLLGLGLVALTASDRNRRGARELSFGWGLFAVATAVLIASAWVWRPVPWLDLAGAVMAMLPAIAWRKSAAIRGRVDDRMHHHNRPRYLYTAAMTAGLLVVGVLPGYLAYQVAFLGRATLLVKHHQTEVHDAMAARAVRLDSIIRQRVSAVSPEIVSREALRPPFDLAFKNFVEVDSLAPADSRSTRSHGSIRAGRWPRALDRVLADRVPFLTDASVRMRQLSEQRADRDWISEGDRLHLRVSEESTLVSALAPAAGRRGWFLGLLGALAGIGLIVYRVSRRVLFIHVEHAEPLTLATALPERGDDWRSTIFVGTRSISREPIRRRRDEVQVIDLMSPRTVSADATTPVLPVEKDKKAVCLDHFDYRITEPKWSRHLLAFLEQHIYSESPRPFIVITSRDPDALLLTGAASPSFHRGEAGRTADASSGRVDDGLSSDEKRRWDRVLGQFTRVMLTDRVPPETFAARVCDELPHDVWAGTNAERVCTTLIRECGHCERLQEVGLQILGRPDWRDLEHDEIVDLIREGAETYYRARWAILTDEERLVVGQLASGAVVNPRSRQAVTRLFARGFVIRGPEPRLDNESFTRFVQDQLPGDRLTMLEREDSPSTWGVIRGPLILGWIGVALFLFWTQQDLLGSTIAFLSTAGVGLGAILRVLTMFERGTPTPDPATRG